MGPRTNVADEPNGLTKDQKAELKILAKFAERLGTIRDELDSLVAERNREMVRACDYYGLDVYQVAEASGMTPQRVNQIFAEMSK